MPITGTIHDIPTLAPAPIDPAQLAAINAAWWNTAMQLGWFCLSVGFMIGAVSVYLYYWRKDHEWDRTYGHI